MTNQQKRVMLKTAGLWLASGVCLAALSGCFAPLITAAQQGYTASQRGDYEAAANSGDLEAQYNLGMTYCCESTAQATTGLSVYDNQKATEWLCKAALQDYGPAQYALAQIYSGEAGGGRFSLIGLAASQVTSKPRALGVAWIWASLAANNTVDGAAELRDKIDKDTPAADMEWALNSMNKDWHETPCLWAQVKPMMKRKQI